MNRGLGSFISGYKELSKLHPYPMIVYVREEGEDNMGINRWSGGIERRKRNETDAKAGDEVPKGKKGDASSRTEASEGPVENEEKRRVVEKLEEREQQDS
jgi:hypothetical protein